MGGHQGAALFTRRAAGRTAAPKVALGDTNFELAQAPVDPRHERMDDPQFQTDDARNVEPRAVQATGGSGDPRQKAARLSGPETVITLKVRPGTEKTLLPLLENLQLLGQWGASREVVIDDFSDSPEKDGDGKHFFDGDGADAIFDIEVKEGKGKDEPPKADKAPKDGDPENHRDPGCDAISAVMEEHKDDPGFRKDDFWDFCLVHNRADCDSGELENINEDEIHRLFDAFMAKKNKKARLFHRQALVHMHTTPPKGAPRPDQRTHLDQDFKAEMDAEKDPDLVRHTTGKSAADVPLLEALAALEHQQWVEWSKDIAETEDLSDERVDRWEEAWVAYSALSDEEKEKDRVYARKIIKLLEKKGIALQQSKEAGRLFS